MTLSVIIIAKNESTNIQACLASVAFADECIVIDGGSTDDTANLALAMGAKVFHEHSWQGFGHQKNLALTHASSDWILSIDADERVTAALAVEIRNVIQQDISLLFEIPRKTNFCGTWINHCGWSPDYVVRLFKRGEASFTNDLVHERVVPLTNTTALRIQKLRNTLLHYSYPTPSHYWKKLQTYSEAWAQQKSSAGMKTTMSRAVLSGFAAFIKSYFLRLGFMDGAMGFAVCFMQAQAAFGKYFSLYCLNQIKK